MNKKLIGLGAVAALALGAVIMLPGTADAYRGDPNVQGPNYSVERHTAMETAFETNNYAAWKELMGGRGRVSQVVTAESFSKFAQAHALAEQGDLAGAAAIRAELGLGLRNGSGAGTGTCTGAGMGRGWNR
jgi:hypothetical protein